MLLYKRPCRSMSEAETMRASEEKIEPHNPRRSRRLAHLQPEHVIIESKRTRRSSSNSFRTSSEESRMSSTSHYRNSVGGINLNTIIEENEVSRFRKVISTEPSNIDEFDSVSQSEAVNLEANKALQEKSNGFVDTHQQTVSVEMDAPRATLNVDDSVVVEVSRDAKKEIEKCHTKRLSNIRSISRVNKVASTSLVGAIQKSVHEVTITNAFETALNSDQSVSLKGSSSQSKAENNHEAWPKLLDSSYVWKNRKYSNFMDNMKSAYLFIRNIDSDNDVKLLTESLITINEECVWQQIAYYNKKLHQYFFKRKSCLDHSYPLPVQPLVKYSTETSSGHDASYTVENDGGDYESTDSFDLNDSKEDMTDMEVSREEMDLKMNKKKYPKSVVDDRFFCLAEMEEFLDKAEKENADQTDNILESIFDDDTSSAIGNAPKYTYRDFYDEEDFSQESSASKQQEIVNESKKKGRRVWFADEVEINEKNTLEDEKFLIQNEKNEFSEHLILLGSVNEEKTPETEFQMRQHKLREKIKKIEENNLAPRTWELSGEATAFNRSENGLLERHVDFDRAARLPPVITIDTTLKLESVIIQRIKDKAFDDVIRVIREPESESKYRASVEEVFTKKSLAEVYEEQYQKSHGAAVDEIKVNEKEAEIEKQMLDLFNKLDALSHYHYIPPQVHPEVKVVNNMAALQKEEVGPVASTKDMLIAPEEVKKHMKGTIKSKDERDKTDRARERRKKKKVQHLKALRKVAITGETNDYNVREPMLKNFSSKNQSTKPSKFFEQLQQTTINEVQNKAKRDEKKRNKINASIKYKL